MGAGGEKVFDKKMSGKTAENRKTLKGGSDFSGEGDTLIETKLDRLAWSIHEIEGSLSIVVQMPRCLRHSRCVERKPYSLNSEQGLSAQTRIFAELGFISA
jgi:DNA invertase Pin-like site-specific DNA recombinase